MNNFFPHSWVAHDFLKTAFFFTEINSCLDSRSSKGTIVYEDDGQSSSFSNSEKILYKFESTDLEDSFHFTNREYQVMIADHGRHDDVIRVLFTRRNIDQEANAFLMNLRPNDVLQDLYDQYELRNSSLMNCCKYRAAPA